MVSSQNSKFNVVALWTKLLTKIPLLILLGVTSTKITDGRLSWKFKRPDLEITQDKLSLLKVFE